MRLYDLRHYYATMLYYRTKDILLVKQQLGPNKLETTLVYTQLVNFNEENEYYSATAKTIDEAKALIEQGFEYVTEIDGIKLFRKRKQQSSLFSLFPLQSISIEGSSWIDKSLNHLILEVDSVGRVEDRLILAMMLIPVFASALSILPLVHGQLVATIYIRPDGSIDPVTAPISSKDNVTYVFSGDVNAHIMVQRDDVVIDGSNYTAQEGIVLSERRNVTIMNTRVVGSIWVAGIYIYNCSDCTISENTVTSNIEGILLFNSSHNTLVGNSVSDNGMSWGRGGLILEHSSYNVLRSNRVANNSIDFNVRSSDLSELIQDMDTSNTIADKPIYYCVNQHGLTIPTDGSYVALVNCTQMTVKNLSLSKNSEGILLASTANSTIAENYIANNINGISLSGSIANMVCDNSIIGNHNGIYATYSDNNTISNNSILRSGSSGSGILLQTCSNTNISFNTLAEHDTGIILGWCTNTLISSNNITDNNYGLYLLQSSKNHVYHNNFVDNGQQVNMPKYDSNSNFDDGYPSGGNYWSDYAARNPNATEIDNTGIWNTPYVIDDYDVDNFPLTMQYIVPEFPSFIIPLLFFTTTLLAITLNKKRRRRTT